MPTRPYTHGPSDRFRQRSSTLRSGIGVRRLEVITRVEEEATAIPLDACEYDGSHGRGYLFVEDRTSLLRQHVWVTWIEGFWHHFEEAQDPSFAPGRTLALIPDPEDPFDPPTIAIWNRDRTKTAGYVPHATVARLSPAHRVDRAGLVVAERVDADGRRTGLLVAVSRLPLRLKLVELDPSEIECRERWLPAMPEPPLTCDAPEAVEAMWEIARALNVPA